MILSSGLLKAIQLSGPFKGKAVQANEIESCLLAKVPIWLHLDYSSTEVIDWLESSGYVEDWAVTALIEEDVRPRAIINKNSFYLSLRTINHNTNQDEEDMVSIRVYVKKGLIITTRKRALGIIDKVANDFIEDDSIDCENTLLVSLINTITDEINHYVEEMIDLVDDIEEKTLFDTPSENREPLTNLRRKILILKRHLNPQREALKQLGFASIHLNKSCQTAFQQQFDDYQRLVEEIDLARERCSLLQERISNKLSEQINRRMYFFSLITALFLPISSVASLFGMNIGGIPLSASTWGFTSICIVLFLTSLIAFLYLKKKSWL